MEDKNNNAIDGQPVAAGEEVKVSLPTEEDLEAKNLALEAEKARLLEEKENYRLAFLKEKSRRTEPENLDSEESDEDKMRRIAAETLANSRIAEIAREQNAIIEKALKENKELKLAQLNKTGVPVAIGSHSEGPKVQDTLVTPAQLEAFKSRGWTDKDIENYKRNLLRNTK